VLHHKQSIYNKQLIYSKRIKEENIRSSASQLSDYRTKLDADIRTAYFEYLQAVTLKEAIMRSVANAQQNLSSIQRLLDQQNLTKESLYKSKSNLSNVQAQLTDIENTRLKNKYYFNFLLNRAQQDTILTDKFYLFDPLKEYKISHEPDTIETYYRLGGLKSAVKSAGLQRSLIHSQNLPVFQFKGTGGISGSRLDFRKPSALCCPGTII
jgi:outer membrane protein